MLSEAAQLPKPSTLRRDVAGENIPVRAIEARVKELGTPKVPRASKVTQFFADLHKLIDAQ